MWTEQQRLALLQTITTFVEKCLHTLGWNIRHKTCTHTQTHTHTHTNADKCTKMNTHAHTNTHTRMHTRTHMSGQRERCGGEPQIITLCDDLPMNHGTYGTCHCVDPAQCCLLPSSPESGRESRWMGVGRSGTQLYVFMGGGRGWSGWRGRG